jgi:hypothetical protein
LVLAFVWAKPATGQINGSAIQGGIGVISDSSFAPAGNNSPVDPRKTTTRRP